MYYREDQTIAALSSAPGIAGIAVLRLSGPNAGPIAASVFKEACAKKPFYEGKSHTIHYGWIITPDGERVDEVLLMWMKGPHCYTGEDTVEINCHGGPYVSRRVLEVLVEAGAVLAEPGEYSKRAYMNGKMDLTKAEAVMDVIASETALSLKASVSQLRGSLFEKTETLRMQLMDLLTEAEVNIDYPEYDVPELSLERMLSVCRAVAEEAEALYDTAETGMLLKSGVRTVIVGAPNVGKSSLLNLLAGSDRAIVTDIPGTTRDTLEEKINLDGVPLCIVDTAGIRETTDTVEKIGVERARRALEESQLVLLVLDAARALTDEERELFASIQEKNWLILLNKSDRALFSKDDIRKDAAFSACPADRILSLSAKEGSGLKELSDKIKEEFFSGITINDHTPLITNVRQKQSLRQAIDALHRVEEAGKAGFELDLLTIDLREAHDALGDISGHSVNADLTNQIFSRFCLGK